MQLHLTKKVLFSLLVFLSPAMLLAEAPVLSNGSPIKLDKLDITITPPAGWEVLLNNRGKAVVMQVPASKEPIKDYSKPTYERNVTVAITHEALPIDEAQALNLRAKIEKDFGSAGGVTNFQIVEHRLMDYRGKNDAILVYTAFDYNHFPMSQMHILVSGANNSALLTYTDLADEFQKNETAMNQAWTSMLSIELPGTAPKRYENLIPAAAALALMILAAGFVLILRRRKAKLFIDSEEENIYESDSGKGRSKRSRAKAESFVTGLSVSHVSTIY